MQNYSKNIHDFHPHPGMSTHCTNSNTPHKFTADGRLNLESRTIYEREENNYEAKGIH